MKHLLCLLAFGLANAFSLQASAATLAIGAAVYLPETDRTDTPDATAPLVLWVPAANGVVPPNAIIGGREPGRSLPVCRAIYNKGVHPGKVVGKNCNYGYGGKEVLAPQYDVLVGNPAVLMQSPQLVRWIAAQGGQVPHGAFFGAYEPGRPMLPICQAPHQGGVHVGKVVGGNCNFGYGGREVLSPQYAVLVVGSIPLVPVIGTGPVAIAAAQNQEQAATMAALQGEVLGLALDLDAAMKAVQTRRSESLDPQMAQLTTGMHGVQAQNLRMAGLNNQLGALKENRLQTTDPVMLAKLDLQIKDITAQMTSLAGAQQIDLLRLQSLSNKRNEAFDLMTNFMNKFTAKRDEIIRNMP